MKKSRIIISFDCPRSCPNCCNTYSNIIDGGIRTANLADCVIGFDQVMITGGEPMLFPKRVKQLIQDIRTLNPAASIFLYTALATPALGDIIDIIDGIHFTLHAEVTVQDILDFWRFQGLLENKTGSYRLYIDSEVRRMIPIVPNLWTRLEVKAWIKEGECALPENETLFILEEEL